MIYLALVNSRTQLFNSTFAWCGPDVRGVPHVSLHGDDVEGVPVDVEGVHHVVGHALVDQDELHHLAQPNAEHVDALAELGVAAVLAGHRVGVAEEAGVDVALLRQQRGRGVL